MIAELLQNPVVVQIRSVAQGSMQRGVNPYVNGRYSDCLVYVRSGSARYDFPDRQVEARMDGVLYLPAKSVYQIEIQALYTYFFVDFDLPELERIRTPFWLSAPTLSGEFANLYREWVAPTVGSRERAFASLYQILARMIVAAELSEQGKERRKIASGVEYINRNYIRPDMRLTDAAGSCGCSDVHFRRLFQRVFGETPLQYLTRLRIQRAKELLVGGELTVTQTALESGYGDVYYFCRAFKRETGQTPGEYGGSTGNGRNA